MATSTVSYQSPHHSTTVANYEQLLMLIPQQPDDSVVDETPKLTLLSLPPELLVYLSSHLRTSQDYLALSATSRQLRACCHSLRPKELRGLMERTIAHGITDEKAATQYVTELKDCKFCDWYFADEKNRRTYAQTLATRRYNLILSHETKDICGGCLTLALALKYCWYPWEETSDATNELRTSYLFAIRARVTDPDKYLHQTF